MTTNKKIVQLSLISIGLFLIPATYFLYPKFVKEGVVEDNMTKTDISDGKERNAFENVEYKGFYDIDKPYKVKSEKAHILTEEPDVIYMTGMHVTLDMNDGRTIIITSDNGRYNKVTYDCFFENNVKAVDGETTVLSENLDLITTEDFATAYNDVFLSNDKDSLQADKIHYNFETKSYRVSMFNDKKVKIKLIKWATLKNLGS